MVSALGGGTLDGVNAIDHRHVVRALGIGRLALGAALLLAPGRAGRGWIGEAARSPGGKVALRALGSRDLVLGYGVIHALDTGDDSLRDWVTLAGLCDLTDAAASVVAFRRLPTKGRWLAVTLAGGAAAAAFVARDRLD